MKKGIFHIGICTKEQNDIQMINRILAESEELYEVRGTISVYNSLDEPDDFCNILIIHIKNRSDLESAIALGSHKKKIRTILIADDMNFAIEGYKARPLRFLVRPVSSDKMKEAIQACLQDLEQEPGIILNLKERLIRICPDDIYYVEIYGRKSKVVFRDSELIVENTMSELENELKNKGFIRSHKSFLVNIGHVRILNGSSVELQNEMSVPVSKRRMKEVKIEVNRFVRNIKTA